MKTNKINTTHPSYRIRNWSGYNTSLCQRGNFTIWIEEARLAAWRRPEPTARAGHPFVYTDELMLLMATLKELYRLPLRQATGFAQGIVSVLHLPLQDIPDYTTLHRRLRRLAPRIPLGQVRRAKPTEPLVLVVDSTGFKVSGEGEWKMRMHGKDKLRKWRKLHVMQDNGSWEIVGMSVTDSVTHDDTQVPALLAQALRQGEACRELLGDGAYDKRVVYESVQGYGGRVIAPPNKAAVTHPRDPVLQGRNETIETIHASSLKDWKHSSGYHRRSRVESTMFRYKRAFGDELLATTDASQYAQLRIRTRILNYFTKLGMPVYDTAAA